MHALLGAADPTPAVSVVRAGEGVRLLHDGDPEHGVARALVHQGRDIEAIEVSGAPPDFAEPYSHPGAELLYVVSGEVRSEEHTSELQSLMRISYAVFCLKKK